MNTEPISEKSLIEHVEYQERIEELITYGKDGISELKMYSNREQSLDSLLCGIKNNLIETIWLQSRSELNHSQNYYFPVQYSELEVYEHIKSLSSIYKTKGIMTNITNPSDKLRYEILKQQDNIVATFIETHNQIIISYLNTFGTYR